MTTALFRIIDREQTQAGLFVTFEEPSRDTIDGRDYPRIQILTIRQALEEGKKPMLPLLILPTYQQAERIPTKKAAERQEMFD